jgi:hypothetical protein
MKAFCENTAAKTVTRKFFVGTEALMQVSSTPIFQRTLLLPSANFLYSSAPVSVGNTFQDLPQLCETSDNNECYI